MVTIQQVLLFRFYLDLRKAYNTLYLKICIDILKEYGTCRHIVKFLSSSFLKQNIIAKDSGYHGEPFTETRGVTQGDIISPTIFNVAIGVVVWYWISQLCGYNPTSNGIGYYVVWWGCPVLRQWWPPVVTHHGMDTGVFLHLNRYFWSRQTLDKHTQDKGNHMHAGIN